MTWLPIAALVVAIIAVICGVGFGIVGVDSRDGRDWHEQSIRRETRV